MCTKWRKLEISTKTDTPAISKSTAKRDLNMMFDKNLIRRITIKQTYYFFV